jgi:enolase
MIIKEVETKSILDSRKEKTIEVSIKTDVGNFSASSPNGKSTGKHEAKSYKKNLEGDIKSLKDFSDYFSEEIIEKFEDLKRIEDIVEGHIGANSLFALEAACLKAIAKEQKKEVWEIVQDSFGKGKNLPRPIGNCIGGGKHSKELGGKRPDFQEFLLIPNSKSIAENIQKNKKAQEELESLLKKADEKFKSSKNDENSWETSLDDKKVLEILNLLKIPLGIDLASSSFAKRKKYYYQNPMLKRDSSEQFFYISNLIKNFDLLYVEDPFSEEEFEGFSKLLEKFPDSLIVGDDLTVTSVKRLKEALKKKSINAIIVKPNQCGSILEVKEVCELARKNKIKIIFSHRSGETKENILADLAFGFQADFIKCGIWGSGREEKLKRLTEIEKSLK